MAVAPLPPNETERLADLRSFQVLDTADEAALDEIVDFASTLFGTPIALVSLVDENRQWFKARAGLDARETPRELSFCAHAILEPEVMVIEDAKTDTRFDDNDLVTGDPFIRFYAGAPLVSDGGNRLGALCIIDSKPRTLSDKEQEILQLLAKRVMSEMHLRRANRKLQETQDTIKRLFATVSDGVVAVGPDGIVSFADERAETAFGSNALKGRRWQDALPLTEASLDAVQELLADPARGPVSAEVRNRRTRIELRAVSVPDSQGEIALVLADITELSEMRAILTTETSRHGIVGRAAPMQTIFRQIEQVAPLDIAVLVSGETGTGKDVVANAIHSLSTRRAGSFVAINCGALTESLLSSQLFGHRRGAFTGAINDQRGLFEAGSGGTVFLDEIGDMPIDLQVSLLRILDNKQVVRLGETEPRDVDFRLISASNRKLEDLIAEGRFREDLYYRIRGLDIRMPPLRDRREDIPLLIEHFARIDALVANIECPQFTQNAVAAMLQYNWPGNVRELRSAVSYAVLQSPRDVIRRADLPPEVTAGKSKPETDMQAGTSERPNDSQSAQPGKVSRETVVQALEDSGGNRSRAARMLGISRATLYRRLQEFDIKS